MNAIDHELAEKFRRLSVQHRRALDQASLKTGLCRSQHHLLMSVSRMRLSSQKELAARLDLTPAAVTQSLKKLEKGGYVRRVTDPSDNRCHQIDLSEKGEAVLRQSIEIFHRVDTEMFAHCSAEEKQILLRCLDKMYESLLAGNVPAGSKEETP